MEKKILLLLVLFTASAIHAIGQSEFLGSPGSAYIDNVSDSEAVKLGLLAEPLGATADENRFWITRKISAAYSFAHAESKPLGLNKQDAHAFVPELYLESANGLSLNVGGIYAHSTSGSFYSKTKWDTYGISVQPAYDTLTLWDQENRPEFMKYSKLIFGLGLAYSHDEAEVHDNFAPPWASGGYDGYDVQVDSFLLNPNVVFVQPLCERFITFLIPAYSMEWSHAKLKGTSQTSDGDYGLFTLTARGDYKVTERFFASAFATWKRDITSRPEHAESDWAEFGGQLRFAISERMAVRAGYSYDAFNRYFEAHHCFARLEASF